MGTHSDSCSRPRQWFGWLLPALMSLTGAAAQASSSPTLIVSGTVGSSTQNLDGYAGTVAFDTSAWWGKPYTLELKPNASGVSQLTEPIDGIPGAVSNSWSPVSLSYRLTIDGNLVFAGTDLQFSDLSTANDVLIPAGMTDLPAGIVADGTHTYDFLTMRFSGINHPGLGCFSGGSNGVCGDDDDILEYGTVRFEYAWDTAVREGLSGDAYPDLQKLVFADGVGIVSFTVGHFTPAIPDVGADRVMLPFGVTAVGVTPVPEPATWGMLLAGLGLVGGAAASRRQ